MGRFAILKAWIGKPAVLPPITNKLQLSEPNDHFTEAEPVAVEPEPISAFLCIIDYDGENRLLTCRRYSGIGESRYVGAVCHAANGYRQFRCDRINAVFDAQTGEMLGDGSYFARFSLDEQRDRAPTWGLNASRKSKLVAGLNALSFMARCDGQWHSLESEVIESFIVSLWIKLEWPGDPDIAAIIGHTERLAPDAETFFRAIRLYAQNDRMKAILRRAMSDLIAADGEICPAEMDWASEMETMFRDLEDQEYQQFLAMTPGIDIVVNAR